MCDTVFQMNFELCSAFRSLKSSDVSSQCRDCACMNLQKQFVFGS